MLNRLMCLLALLMWAFLPCSVVIAVWQADWRWIVTGIVIAVAGVPVGWLGVQGAKAATKAKATR